MPALRQFTLRWVREFHSMKTERIFQPAKTILADENEISKDIRSQNPNLDDE